MPTFSFHTHTGESHQHLSFRPMPPSPALLSCPDKNQQRLESAVFRALSGIDERSAHPLHVGRIRLVDGDAPIVFLDGDAEGRSVCAQFLETVLPTIDSDGYVEDSPGIRIRGARGRDLHLGFAQTDALLIIRGVGDIDWAADLKAHQRNVDQWGTTTLSRRPTLTAEEREFLEGRSDDPLVALESKLLRRIGVFTRFSAAHCTYTYSNSNTLKVWLELNHKVPGSHDLLVAALTDPQWGLGMLVQDQWCTCYRPGRDSCSVTLVTPSGDASLVLMLNYCESRLSPEDFASVGADDRWISRVFPPSASLEPWSERRILERPGR
ncbi:hypothetical protein G4X40_09125 [Rhodococcus sp. D2-41]|uniref:hypothetical protein n=1 Tax=Speluncibacter jeojiensis TaxID=2710754 RepID=UPI00240FC487|nr:hypothetical protein [Rhodococcus sp. D2-41]MDG3010313.1 hypothetical protein [Rhodococcus sp. D2-41]